MSNSIIIPSFRQGFARGSLSQRPNLWKGLVGCWKPSLGVTGMELIDVSGWHNHGTLINMTLDDWAISGNPKLPGYALDFDGVDDYVEIADSDILTPSTALSIFVWVNANAWNATSDGLVFKYNGGDSQRSWSMGMAATGKLQITLSSTVSPFNGIQRRSTTAMGTGDWFAVGFVFDGNSTSLRLYENGVELGTTDIIGSVPSSLANNTRPVFIGYNDLTDYFNGTIGDVRIYNRALSASEIWDIYQRSNAMFEFADMGMGRVVAVAVNADLTLPQLSLSAFSSPGIVDITLPQVTVDSAALSHGIASLSLPVLTVNSTGTPGINAASLTLPQFVVQGGSGATGNISLPTLTVLSSALSHGVSSLNLPVLTVLGTGTTGVTSASLTLPIITINALAKNHADANLLLPALSLSATDVAPATSSITLPVLAVLSSATSLHGDASLALPVLTVLSSAISLHGDTSLTLPVLTVISTSTIASNGDVAVTFPVLIVSASSGLGGDIDLPALRLAIRAYNGSPPECVVMNTKSSAITEYKDYAFNSYTRFNGVDLAANQNGIYALDTSSLDESTYKIKAHIKTGQVDLYKESIQRLRNAYLTHETDGDVRITSVGDKAATRTYYLALQNSLNGVRERRIKFERGIRNRHFDFKIENIDGSELEIDGLRILIEPIISKRR